jgi:PII-like signaling protein
MTLEEIWLLRIFVGENDRWQGRPLYEALVQSARQRGLAGASVFKGIMGFGHHSVLHSSRLLQLSQDLPILIEIADREERINQFLPLLNEMMGEGLVLLEKVHAVRYRH